MARINAAKFWKTVKSVSVREIAKEAEKPFALALVGQPEKRADVYRRLFPSSDEEDVVPERSLIRQFNSTAPDDGFPEATGSFDIVIDAGGGRRNPPPNTPVYSVDALGGWDELVDRLLEQRSDLALSLGRRFPGLRGTVAQRVIRDTSTANAEFAMLSALPGVIPFLSILLPASAIGDIFMLTKNQAMMLFRLASLHELPLDAASRSGDLAPLLANAFGWRAIAREVVGAVPGGIGLVARGSIAYAGTMALGKGIEKLYSTGVKPTRAQISALYRESLASAKETVKGIARRITKPPRQIEE